VEDMLEFAKTKQGVLRHLPDERDWDHMDRKWLSDVLYTVEKAAFDRMIKDAIKERKERLEDKNNLNVSMRPEFVQAFQNCMSFSSKILHLKHNVTSGEWSSLTSLEVLL
jgi:hypothetical protein